MRLQGKIILVTGAASGIGHAVAELFASEGAIVFASDIASPKLAYSDGIEALKLDVTREEDWEAAVDTIVEKTRPPRRADQQRRDHRLRAAARA